MTTARQPSVTTFAPFVIRPGRSSLRTTFQHAADIVGAEGQNREQVFERAAHIALDWLGAKMPQPLPGAARNMDSFELDHHGQQQLIGVAVPEEGLWCARLVQPDAPFNDRPAVAGRTWTTDLALHRSESNVRFAARVQCASASYADEPIALTRPRIVIDLARNLGLRESLVLDGRPWMLQTSQDLEELHDLLTNPMRSMPVVVLTHPNRGGLPGKLAEYLLDHEYLAKKLQGLAHVVCMPAELAYQWTDMVGKVWSVFMGAVRTYQPGLDFDEDSPFRHPRALPNDVVFWRYGGGTGEEAFLSFLVDKVYEYTATKAVRLEHCLFYPDARTRRAVLTRERINQQLTERASTTDEVSALKQQIEALNEAHAEEVASLNEQNKQAADELDVALQMGEAAESVRSRIAQDNHSLQGQNDALRMALRAKGQDVDTTVQLPGSYEDLPEWVQQHMTGRLILHPRAIKALKKAAFNDHECVCRSLLLLAASYRSMKFGVEGAMEEWNKGLGDLGLQCDRSISRERAGEQGDKYFVPHPHGTNQKTFLEWHLTKGSTKDDRMCMRIYFFWDENSSQVVVGWLPSHLDTRAT